MPFLLSEDRTKLIGHLAKPNPQWKSIEGQEVLVVFMHTHGYVSPGWYKEAGVPTWNYQAVHIYGHTKIIHDEESLVGILAELSNQYESSQSNPWEPSYNKVMLKGIVGFEIEIKEIQCKYKLSQNKSIADRVSVAEQLTLQGNHQLSEAMRKYN